MVCKFHKLTKLQTYEHECSKLFNLQQKTSFTSVIKDIYYLYFYFIYFYIQAVIDCRIA